MKKLKFAIFGVGRMGSLHLSNIDKHPNCEIVYICDTALKSKSRLKRIYKDKVVRDFSKVFKDKSIDVIFISSSTNSHLKLIIASIKSKKNIFCEKPIDLDLNKINKFKNICSNFNKTFQIGFNRRYDPSISALVNKSKSKKIGNVEKVIITSRDRSAPSLKYLKTSGGILKDCVIHDIDLLLNIFGEDKIKEVFCYASNLFDKNIKKIKDYDTIVSIFKTFKGKIGMINNSRRSVYGYDQRVEVFSSEGMIQTNNINELNILEYNKDMTSKKPKYLNFFLERYKESFKIQLDDFVKSVINKKKSNVGFEDCRKALIICDALSKSIKLNKSIKVNFD